MAKIHQNVLLVEGKQDRFTIPELIEANGVNWGTRNNPVVYIRDCEGYQNLIDSDVIAVELQASGLSTLGIIVDADENPSGRWQSIYSACRKSIPDIPDQLSEDGLIHTTSEGIRFGVWIMPDNQAQGMLETFLSYMIPTETDRNLWQFAQETAQTARGRGAPFTAAHLDKAQIYTWLAWQDPPGRQLHQAIQERMLDPQHPRGQKFMTWFKTLYRLNE
jgi:hypothetical protein